MTKDIAKYLIYFLLGVIFAMTFFMAKDAASDVSKVSTRVAVIECQMQDLAEIKADVKLLLRTVGVK